MNASHSDRRRLLFPVSDNDHNISFGVREDPNVSASSKTNTQDLTLSFEDLTIKVPSSVDVMDVDEDDEPKTPTSEEHKIPEPTTCPGAPRRKSSLTEECEGRAVVFQQN